MQKKFLALAFALAMAATPVLAAQPQPWTAPTPGSAEAAVLVPINNFVKGISTRNIDLLRSSELPEGGGITIANENPDGTKQVFHLDWEAGNAKVAAVPANYEDKISDPYVTIDGDIAFAWAQYVVSIDGKPHHCGTEHYSLVRRGGEWKISENTWSQKTTGCDASK